MTQAFRCIRDYAGLVDALRDERIARGMSCLSLDARAGFHEGYANKLENWDKPYGRGLGPVSLNLWLEALGLAIVVVRVAEPPKKTARVEAQLSLPLIGGRMNTALVRKGFRRYAPPALAA